MFWQLPRAEQILLMVYVQERDLEEVELSGMKALGNLEVGDPVE